MFRPERITKLRKTNGWSQEELGFKLGVSRQAVSRWESGTAVPETEKIIELSKLFGVSAGYLLGTEDEPDIHEEPATKIPERRKQHWLPLILSLSLIICLLYVVYNQSRKIQILRQDLNLVNQNIAPLSYKMDEMKTDLADAVEEKLLNDYSIMAEYSLSRDVITRENDSYRVILQGIMRIPEETVRFFAKDVNGKIYYGETEETDPLSGSLKASIEIPLQKGTSFYVSADSGTMKLSPGNYDLFETTELSCSVVGSSAGIDEKDETLMNFSAIFSIYPPVVNEPAPSPPDAVNGVVDIYQDGTLLKTLEAVSWQPEYPDSGSIAAFMEVDFQLEKPQNDAGEYLLYAKFRDNQERQFSGYAAKLIFTKTPAGALNPVSAQFVPVDSETGN